MIHDQVKLCHLGDEPRLCTIVKLDLKDGGLVAEGHPLA